MISSQKKPSSAKLLWKFAGSQQKNLILSSFLAIIGVLSGILPYFCIAALLNRFYEKNASLSNICILCAIILTAFALKSFLNSASTTISHVAAFRILKNVRQNLSSKMERIPMGVMLGKASGTYKMLVIDQVERLEKPLAHMIPEMTANLFTPSAILIVLFVLDWRMAIGAIATIPVGFLVTMGQMIGYKEKSAKYQKSNAEMNDAIVEYVNGIEVIKAFNQSISSFGRFANACTNYRDTVLEWWRSCWLFSAAGLTLLSSTLLVTLPLGAYLFMKGEISFAIFLTCSILSMGLSGPLISAMSYAESFAYVFQAISQIGDFLDEEEQIRPTKYVDFKDNSFEFRNVHFGYKEKNVLNGISFKTVEPGITAIVGHSGSGKSTIAKLMAGFWDVGKGEILLGQVPLSQIPFAQQMAKISYVSQDNYLFNISIRENIRMGKPFASDAEVIEAARAAGCHEFISDLPNGYDTLAGDAGKKLSGGERQRITIARAILKNADIVILDEATAYTDPENELEIEQAISRMIRGKVLIVIAHRLSTIQNADSILVIENGALAASGRHAELLKNSPVYKALWENHLATSDKQEVA